MKKILIILCSLLLLQSVCFAEIYRWKDDFDNRVGISSTWYLIEEDKPLTTRNKIVYLKNFLNGKELDVHVIEMGLMSHFYGFESYESHAIKIDGTVYYLKPITQGKWFDTSSLLGGSYYNKGALGVPNVIIEKIKNAKEITLRINYSPAGSTPTTLAIPPEIIEEWKQVISAPEKKPEKNNPEKGK